MCWDLCLAIKDGDLERAKELLDNGSSVHDREVNYEEYDRWTPLQFAHESVEMTELLLDRGASLTSTDATKTAFHIASENGCFEVVRLYLNWGAEVDMFGQYGSPLFYASKRGRLRVARLLLGRGADVNLYVDCEVGGPLHVACSEGHFDMVKLLVRRGADVNAGSDHFNAPLTYVSKSGSVEIARFLLENGATMGDDILSCITDDDGNVQLDVLRLFLDHGADPESSRGFPLLIWASSSGKVETVRLLLDRGCGVDGFNGEEGPRPLHQACGTCEERVARLLIDRGADVNAIDGDGQTPLHAVVLNVMGYDLSDLVRLLLDRGAAVDTKTRKKDRTTRKNETALHIASRCNEEETVELLLERGANVMAQDEDGNTPLHGPCETGCLKIVHLLLDRGATSAVNVMNRSGRTPLHLACCMEYERPANILEHGHLKIARLLLERGANVNANDKNLKTPLHLICERSDYDYTYSYGCRMDEDERDAYDHEFLEIVRLLLDQGANVEAKAKNGLTPMHLACQKNNLEFVWLFVRRCPWLVLGQSSCPIEERKKKRKKRKKRKRVS